MDDEKAPDVLVPPAAVHAGQASANVSFQALQVPVTLRGAFVGCTRLSSAPRDDQPLEELRDRQLDHVDAETRKPEAIYTGDGLAHQVMPPS
jgi:hypothetical protein